MKVDGKLLTDVDLVAFKDGYLFLGQSKIVIPPDGAYEVWKVDGKLDRAARQLDKCVQNLDAIEDAIMNRVDLAGETIKHKVAFVMTNTRHFTERKIRGYSVVDIPYLHFVLSGARGAVIGFSRTEFSVGSGASHIAGDTPSGAELASLIDTTIHRVRERGIVYVTVTKRIGEFRLRIPMMRLRTPGRRPFVVTSTDG